MEMGHFRSDLGDHRLKCLCFVLTRDFFGYPNLTHTHIIYSVKRCAKSLSSGKYLKIPFDLQTSVEKTMRHICLFLSAGSGFFWAGYKIYIYIYIYIYVYIYIYIYKLYIYICDME